MEMWRISRQSNPSPNMAETKQNGDEDVITCSDRGSCKNDPIILDEDDILETESDTSDLDQECIIVKTEDSMLKSPNRKKQKCYSENQPERFFQHDDKRIPIFCFLKSQTELTKKEKDEVLYHTLNTLVVDPPDPSFICSIPPRCVMNNRAFIVDTSKLKNHDDVLADDCGSWINNGHHQFFYQINEEGVYERVGRRASFDTSNLTRNWLTIHRRYYDHKDSRDATGARDFHRIVSFVTDKDGRRLPLTKVDYQFTGMQHRFRITAHGSSKNTNKPYIRTQKSTINHLKEVVATSQPRIAIDRVAEELGGMSTGSSSGSWPKDVKQAYNLKSKSICNLQSVPVACDPYFALVMQCKEDAKDPKTAFIRQVTCAPEPVVILATDEQLDNIVKFCTNIVHFGVFAVDPTFDLGSFSVTTTTYENLHLISRRGGVHPVMIGRLLIHQKKEAATYSVLVDYLLKSRPALRNLRVLGTDGELSLSTPFLEKCPDLIHLLCFIHVKNNIVDHLKAIGVDERNRRCIISDLFGQQQGVKFEEGIVDSDDEEEFRVRLSSLKNVWIKRLGPKGLQFYQWFMKNKANIMETKMLRPVRIRAGLGQPPKPYYTNRVECANSLLSSETDHKESSVDKFVASMRALTERQARNVRWAIINKGPYQLHPGLSHLQLMEETWFQMSEDEKESYLKMVLQADVSLTATCTSETLKTCTLDDNLPSAFSTNNAATHGLSILAKAAISVLDFHEDSGNTEATPEMSDALEENFVDENADIGFVSSLPRQTVVVDRAPNLRTEKPNLANEFVSPKNFASPANKKYDRMMGLREFSQFFAEQPPETVQGIYDKAKLLLGKPNGIVPAPGCDPKARMVESTRLKERPHLVTPGKSKREYRCEKNCPHFNGIRICAHSVATAQQNGELSGFLSWFRQNFSKKGANLTATAKTDMPQNPGRKGGKTPTSRREPKLPVAERVKRTYTETAPLQVQSPNTNPFYLKKMNTRIKVCQGCRGSLKSAKGALQHPPFDYCVAREERRLFTDRKSGELRTPNRETAAHYHLKLNCIKAAERSFVACSLQIPGNLGDEITSVHKAYLRTEFGLKV